MMIRESLAIGHGPGHHPGTIRHVGWCQGKLVRWLGGQGPGHWQSLHVTLLLSHHESRRHRHISRDHLSIHSEDFLNNKSKQSPRRAIATMHLFWVSCWPCRANLVKDARVSSSGPQYWMLGWGIDVKMVGYGLDQGWGSDESRTLSKPCQFRLYPIVWTTLLYSVLVNIPGCPSDCQIKHDGWDSENRVSQWWLIHASMANNEQETRILKIINFCTVFGHISTFLLVTVTFEEEGRKWVIWLFMGDWL